MNKQKNTAFNDDFYSPVVLFVYNRVQHTKHILDALSNNTGAEQTELYIYCDGPKLNSTAEDKLKIENVRSLVSAENRFKKVSIIKREINLGLSKSIINGVSEIVKKYGKVIVLEDDIVPAKGFLTYMNQALKIYYDNDQVGCIHAWNYSFNTAKFPESTFFLRGADCWGWATWERSWKLFNTNGEHLLKSIYERKLEYIFERRGTHNFVNMLKEQILGRNDSWAILWHASLVLSDKYCLFPVIPIVKNIGLDNTGTHCGNFDWPQNVTEFVELKKIPIKENELFFKEYRRYRNSQIILKIKIKIRRFAKLKPYFPSIL